MVFEPGGTASHMRRRPSSFPRPPESRHEPRDPNFWRQLRERNDCFANLVQVETTHPFEQISLQVHLEAPVTDETLSNPRVLTKQISLRALCESPIEPPKMITKFMTEITTKFNPFSPAAKSARLFMSNIPPTARSTGTTIKTILLPRTSTEPASLYVKFSTFPLCRAAPTHVLHQSSRKNKRGGA